jgi:signal transduction histidine kinase/CheY-like chemotaxis protein
MQTYTIDSDLIEQRQKLIALLLGISLLVGLPVFGFSAALSSEVPDAPVWLFFAIVLLVANEFRRRQRVTLSAWVYLGGLVAVLGLALATYGPSATSYLLFFIPIVLAALLLSREDLIIVSVICLGLSLGLTTIRTDFKIALNLLLVPGLVGGLLVAALAINATNALEMVRWATDVQQKDARRAEVFYQQKEQLSEALLQLNFSNSKLQQVNVKLAEAQLKAEQASKAKSVFLSNMSHELRTPLNVIIGYASTMLDMPTLYNNVPLPPAYRSDVHLVKDSGYHLLGLINDVLDLSKIEAGKLELHPTRVDLVEMLRGTIATSVGLIQDKPIQVRPDFPTDLPPVWADPIRVRQIILNLMSNAIKFTHTGTVTLQARAEGQSVQIAVIDTGIGIPAEALAHIFDRFEQAARDTDKLYGGTGLGLDISKQLALMHGSDLCVQSVEGQGSTFSFDLPILGQGDVQTIQPVDNVPASAKTLIPVDLSLPQTILLIEDEASLRDMMRRALEDSRYVVVDVQDGAQVLDLATGLLPELILLDIRLPNVDGWSLLKSLKTNPDTAPIPVIVCTVSDEEQRALELGASLYLGKPFSSDEFLACVQELLPQSLLADGGVS